MLLYRAINSSDAKKLENNGNIECSLIETHKNKSRKNHQIYYDLCINGNMEFALDCIVSHIMGNRLRAGLSSWISTTKDFNFACSEYAMPQAGAYNESGTRKPVIIVESNEVLDDIDNIKNLRNKNNVEDLAIDTSNGNLKRYYGKAFLAEAYNEKMPGFDLVKSINYEHDPSTLNINGINNYALCSQEVLFFKQIKKDKIKCIIYPLFQDILYGCNIDTEKNINFLKNNIDTIYEFLSNIESNKIDEDFLLSLYPSYKSSNNLTDYLYNNYNNVDGTNIYEKYNNLKNRKKELLKQIITEFNKEFGCNLFLQKIVDDEILVLDLDNPFNITNKQMYDLLLVKYGNTLYKYNPNKKNYNYEEKELDRNKIKLLIKK